MFHLQESTVWRSYDHILVICLLLIIAYFSVFAIYNLYFHPLAHTPGPLLAKISTLLSWYHACKGDHHIWLWQNFQIYGHKFRAHPNCIVYNDPISYSQIYNVKANVRRSDLYKTFQADKNDVVIINTTDNAIHAEKRRLLSLAFTDKAVRMAGKFVSTQVDRWHELLLPTETKEWTEPQDFSRQVSFLILDILGDLCLGQSFKTMEHAESPMKILPRLLSARFQFLYLIGKSPFNGMMHWLRMHGLDKLTNALLPNKLKICLELLLQTVLNRMTQEKEFQNNIDPEDHPRRDMFHFLVQAQDPQTGKPAYSEQDVYSDAVVLFVAGSDTTATALSAFFFYITQNVDIYTKLVSEIRDAFPTVEGITSGTKLYECRYLRACLEETLRLAPPVLCELSQTILPGGMEVDGDFLPGDITIAHSAFTTGRNEECFPDANIFRPERWIVDEKAGITAEMVVKAKSCAMAFSSGSFSCIGKNLAMLEMLTVSAKTLYRMEVRRAPGTSLGEGKPELGWGRGDKNQYQLKDAFIAIRQGPMLQFKRRSD